MTLISRSWTMIVAFTIALVAGTTAAAAQGTATIQGTVRDSATQLPILGARVTIVGGTAAAATDTAGRYSLRVAPGAATVRVQRIGYAQVDRRVTTTTDETTTADFVLHPVAVTLSEVLVVGYGTENRRQVTGAVSNVTSEQIINQPVAGVDAALQGKTPGVQVTQNSGDPGNGITVRIRGAASLAASNQPLYVVDGVPITTENIQQLGPNAQDITGVTGLDPDEIESITVLKDAASAAIYGSRAANGVVMITTKRGASGRARFEVNAYTGVQSVAHKLSMLNAQQYVAYMNEGAANDGYGINYVFTPGVDDAKSTDWQDAIFRSGTQAPISNIHLGVSGGTERLRYNLGGSYFGQTGIVLGSDYNRASALVNVDFDATQKFSLSSSIKLSREKNDRINGDNSDIGVVTNAIGQPSIYPVRNSDGSFASPVDGLVYSNSVAIATINDLPTLTHRVIGNVDGKYQLAKSLSLTGRVGADYLNLNEDQWQSPLVLGTYAASAAGVSKSAFANRNKWMLESFLNYAHEDANGSSFDVVGGASVEWNHRTDNFIRGEGFSSPDLHYVQNATVITDFSGFPRDHNLSSFFARANYSWKDRYLLSGSIRRDASSRFGPDNRWGTFPAISAGWVLSDEPWMGDFGKRLGTFKLRASYGVTGNEGIPDYAYLGTFTTTNYGTTPGISPNTFANPNLKWESTKEFDVGFDWSPFGGRVSFIGDYYHKSTSDLLVDRPIPSLTGFTDVFSNIGSVLNRGFELGINTVNFQPSTKDGFSWRSDFNISTNHNEVTALYDNQPFGDNDNFRPISRVQVGQPLGAFYVLHFKGVDPQTGDAIYEDVDGDGSITASDRVIAGNPQPKWWGGLGNTFSWKSLDLRTFLEFSHGAKVFNLMRIFADDGGYNWDNKFTDVMRRWQKPGDITDEPRASYDGTSGARLISDRFIEDGSYLRIQEITLGWKLPAKLVSFATTRNAKLYVSARNLHTFTKYSGYDPDVNSNGSSTNIALGTDYYAYPRARTFTIGVTSEW